ncbi:riboflavin synthase subunit alpha [Actinophytocola xinjiangensis]|uniref:Riboflavin synthase n=1 Tax=Actinophytocola xinjiangensis TaxID=485602 RepID=A0A7Z0WQZ1_9PSEU|nr:riboflavin synthase [Actinophytocola xinjiangensis]OLF13741.1 riboflavin synthase subunit alpha [Actinophytocola xinjiangensis]
MFTGIVEERGTVVAVESLPDAARLSVEGPLVTADVRHGDSIAVNGVCLTVVAVDGGTFTADVMRETLDRSSLGKIGPGEQVNLERAAEVGKRFGGHIVQGHVDGTGVVLTRQPSAHWDLVRIGLPSYLARYLVEKGSITVDGVSLTVVDVTDDDFSVSLIPETLQATTLGVRQPGDLVNLEVDVVAKYIERLAAPHLPAAWSAAEQNGRNSERETR